MLANLADDSWSQLVGPPIGPTSSNPNRNGRWDVSPYPKRRSVVFPPPIRAKQEDQEPKEAEVPQVGVASRGRKERRASEVRPTVSVRGAWGGRSLVSLVEVMKLRCFVSVCR